MEQGVVTDGGGRGRVALPSNNLPSLPTNGIHPKQIHNPTSNSTYREWVKDASHITTERPRRAAGGGGDDAPSPTAKNNAAANISLRCV